MDYRGKLGILAEEVVLGPHAGRISLADRVHDVRVVAERERLVVRFDAILTELSRSTLASDPAALEEETFRRVRDEVLPKPTSSFLALDEVEVVSFEGRRLFSEVKGSLELHYKFERPWHASIAALFVMQAVLAPTLPAVFYLIIKGRFGGGKTSLLNLIATLGGGLVFENVSVSALVREMCFGRLVCIDEFDVKRAVDVQPVMDSVVRQGYRRNAAPYTRYNAKTGENERLPIFGPKAVTVRKFLDPALEDRGFLISAAPVAGAEAYGFVVRNLWAEVSDLPVRLRAWGERASAMNPNERLRESAMSSGFVARVETMLKTTGANRGTELAIVALLVSDIAGVDIAAELAEATELKRASVGTEDASELEDLTQTILGLIGRSESHLEDGATAIRVWVRDIKTRIDADRKARGERPIADGRLDTLLTELGISASWKVRPKNRVGFDLPLGFVQALRGEEANPPNRVHPVDVDGRVRDVRPVSPPLLSDGVGLAEESDVGTTRTDVLRRKFIQDAVLAWEPAPEPECRVDPGKGQGRASTLPLDASRRVVEDARPDRTLIGALSKALTPELDLAPICSRFGLDPYAAFPSLRFHGIAGDSSRVVVISRVTARQIGGEWGTEDQASIRPSEDTPE